jgi:hypothetical protein
MLNNDFLPLFPGAQEQGLCFVYTNPIRRERAEQRADDLNAATIFQILKGAGVEPMRAAEIAGLPEITMAPVPATPVPATPEPAAAPGGGLADPNTPAFEPKPS